MLDALTLTRLSQACELTFVETGQKAARDGYWFETRAFERVFLTDQDVFERLERRNSSLFPKG